MFLKEKIEKVTDYMCYKSILSLAIILQIGILFTLFYYSASSYMDIYKKYKNLKNSLGNTELYYIQNNEDYTLKLYNENNIDNYSNFYSFLKENYNILNRTKNNLYIKTSDFPNEIANVLESASITNSKIDEDVFSLFTGYWVNEEFINHFNLKLCTGRWFTEKEFSEDKIEQYTPIILGNFFYDMFKLGDKIKCKDNNYNGIIRTFIVVGFLDEKQYILNKPVMFTDMPELDKCIILPNTDLDIQYVNSNLNNKNVIDKINLINYKNITESFIVLNDPNNDIQRIKSMAIKDNFYDIDLVGTESCISKFNKYYNSTQNSINGIMILLGLAIILQVVNIVKVSIISRKKEFGVYYAIGAQKKDIFSLIIIQIALYFIIGGILNLIILFILKLFGYSIDFNINIYLFTWLIILVLILISIIGALIQIGNVKINNLIKENE